MANHHQWANKVRQLTEAAIDAAAHVEDPNVAAVYSATADAFVALLACVFHDWLHPLDDNGAPTPNATLLLSASAPVNPRKAN